MWKFVKRSRVSNSEEESAETLNELSTSEAGVSDIKKVRLYDDKYLSFGFTWCGDPDCPVPLCVVCGKKLGNTAMVPSKLEQHFTTNHSQLLHKTADYFKHLLESQVLQSNVLEKKVTVSEKAKEASYLVAELVAQKKKSHVIAESIIMPACKMIVNTMLGKEALCEVAKVPLTVNTISTCIHEMSEDIENNVSEMLKNMNFCLQVDESSDRTNKCHVIAFVRLINEGGITENFLCYKELPETTKGEDIFSTLSIYLEGRGLSWERCIGICTDGAPSVTGKIKVFVSLVKGKNPNVITTHCFLHREALISNTIGEHLNKVLSDAVAMINFIKQCPLSSRLFAKLCEVLEKDDVILLQHTEIRWLLRGKVLTRVFELREELHQFFKEHDKAYFAFCFEDNIWLHKLAYLADIYQHLNKLNSRMEGNKENILTCTDKILAFKTKLGIWKNYISKSNFEMFPHLLSQATEMDQEVAQHIQNHLGALEEQLCKYFPSLTTSSYDWVRNPFSKAVQKPENLNLQEKEELTELQCDHTLKMKFMDSPLDQFWITIKEEYPSISEKALNVLLQFSSSYICEQGFSCVTTMRSKDRNRLLSLEDELRVCLSKIRPRIKQLCKNKQAQVSQ